MSYIVTTRQSAPACDGGWAGVRRAFGTRSRLGADIPSDYANWDVPGTGQTVADLRKAGYTDAEIQSFFSQASRLTKGQAATNPVMDWFGQEMITGVKNAYLAAGGGSLLLLAFIARGRRR